VLNWLKRRLSREPSRHLARQITDLVAEAAKSSFHQIDHSVATGELDGRPKRLVAFGELLAYFIHWAARVANAKGLDRNFEDASGEAIAALSMYVNLGVLRNPPKMDNDAAESFWALVQQREFDYSKLGHEFLPTSADRAEAEMMAAFAQAVWYNVARTLTFDGLVDEKVHANFIRAVVTRMHSGFTGLGTGD
jgi:hypothetical protein